MLDASRRADAHALATYLLAGDVAGASMILGLLKPKERREISEAFALASRMVAKLPRLISFSMTTAQVRARTKTVTRRVGWLNLKPGDILQAVEKAQGLKRGEHVKRLCLIRVRKVSRVRLNTITKREVEREGFPRMTPEDFVRFFLKGHKGVTSRTKVTRIEFEYI
jgi:uncharacterized protein YqfB (UPF0267 family)